ncbi:MAG: hypothetical protein QOE28_855 [Solirubrobacteraceae bacterium]|nr:hypothetical protein [Solirubrobacteraceae bacterium]
MTRLYAISALLLALAPFHSSVRPLSSNTRSELRSGGYWHQGCPVALGDLRLLRVTHYGFDHQSHTGQLIVNRTATGPLSSAFRQLYALRFPIRHMRLADFYGTNRFNVGGDATASFQCRQAAASPCTGGRTGSWSMHAYGLAVDVNPRENPYVGCGQSRDPAAQAYRDRANRRPGMVGSRAVRAFSAAGWGWGGSWAGSTKDYMHFSSNGH